MAQEFTTQSSFNLGLAYSLQLNNRLMLISKAFLSQNRVDAHLLLKTLYREISCKLKPEERKLVEYEFAIYNGLIKRYLYLKSLNNSFNIDESKINYSLRIIVPKLMAQLEKIDIILRDYLEKRSLLIPNKRDFSKFENIE